ncbi:hypothetical protein BN871_BZ_00050 [Paenibacillus sp. P22]|nr:hypothetical protein BN871_BZ_00050 [Paenibacillus sp. P22]
MDGCPSFLQEQRRIRHQNFVRFVPVSDPQTGGLLLFPISGFSAAVQLEAQRILTACAGLGNRKGALASILEPDEHRRAILGADRHLFVGGFAAVRLQAERCTARDRLFPDRVDRPQIREDGRDPLACHILYRIAPVRADVRDCPRPSADRLVEPPIIVGIEQQPVLQVAAVHEMDRAKLALLYHLGQLLHHRVLPVVEIDAVHDAAIARQAKQFRRLAACHGQRLLGQHMLARSDNGFVDLEMKVVRRAVMHHVDVWMGQQLPIIAIGKRHAKLCRFFPRHLFAVLGEGDDFDEFEPAHGLDMRRADKAGSDDARPNFGGRHFLIAFLPNITARMMIRPLIIICWETSRPMMIKPLLIVPIMIAPTTVPMIVPTPPNRLVPPRMTAAMTESSSPSPKENRPAFIRPA